MDDLTPLQNIYTPQDQDLTVGRDVQTSYSRLPLNRTANISTPQGFFDDVGDEFMLNWVGQSFQRNNFFNIELFFHTTIISFKITRR